VSYRSHADLGGQTGHGPVHPEAQGNPFHAAWEARALALTLAMGATGAWNIDMSRAARETLGDYANSSYFRIWIGALEKLLVDAGLVQPDEIAVGHSRHATAGVARVLRAGEVATVLSRGSPTERTASRPARFAPGERVRMHSRPVPHHTRLPAYVRGREGVVERVHGMHVFADSHAQGLGEQPQWLYGVVFDADQLWGADAAPGTRVSVDAWESYLQPA
jgi:nitrile hydratase